MNKVPVVLSFTRNYLVPASTTILSILKHNTSLNSYEFICLINEELPDVDKNKIKTLISPDHTVVFINLQNQLKDIFVNARFTIAASYRLILPEILPSYKKVIYIDSDIIVKNDIGELFFNTQLDNYYLAAVDEPALDFQIDYLKQINCSPGEYFNSGFLILNLELLRNDNLVPKFIEGLNNESWQFPDQDILNIECKNKVLKIHPKYNSIRTFFLPQYKDEFLKRYSIKDWEEVQQFGNIHYTGAKPWNNITVKFDEWWKYYQLLPNDLKKDWDLNFNMYIKSIIWRIYPLKFLINLGLKFYRKIKY